jgi:hypothetical protein
MIYTPKNTRECFPPISLIADREGNQVKGRDACYCDTETGEVVQLERDEDGDLIFDIDGNVAKKTLRLKPPLSVVFARMLCSPTLAESGDQNT